MDRVLKNTSLTVSVGFYQDGELADPGAVTVGIVRDNGSEVVAAGTATTGSGEAVRSYTLTASHTADLDTLTITWTSSDLGTLTTQVEIVGGFLCSLAELRALEPLDNTTTYTTALLLEARTRAEQALEEACGVAFAPRYARRRLDGNGSCDLLLPHPEVRTVRAITIDGAALTADELDAVIVTDDGGLYRDNGWARGRQNIVVEYEHGFPTVPGRVPAAIKQLVRHMLVDSPIPDRAISWANEDGSTAMFATAGIRGQKFSLPEVNAVVNQYSYPTVG